ncbi:MAG: 4Fe-4S cluster-binding domain-containing protein, partial [Selenomonadaceae bacterium]|nr:4Fe-4S cluster-binding domain-containing protein [Selenomonadaceae bacterium]
MKIRVAGFEPESFVDGNGIRFTIFFQGCTRNCRGCHNPQTHDLDGGILVTTYEIIREMAKNSLASGITLTGGEPLLQLDAAIEIAKAAQQF